MREFRTSGSVRREGGNLLAYSDLRGLRAWRNDERQVTNREALMTTPIWRVEFHRAAVRDLHKLGTDAEKRILRYLRERIAGSKDPRRFGHALTGDRKGLWRGLVTTASSPPSRRNVLWCW
jgi:hypothetical protein